MRLRRAEFLEKFNFFCDEHTVGYVRSKKIKFF
jgi:hypothetical protein